MLVIRRRKSEAVKIGDGIRVYVQKVTPSYVELSIEAPRDVRIMREELLLKREGEEAGTAKARCSAHSKDAA